MFQYFSALFQVLLNRLHKTHIQKNIINKLKNLIKKRSAFMAAVLELAGRQNGLEMLGKKKRREAEEWERREDSWWQNGGSESAAVSVNGRSRGTEHLFSLSLLYINIYWECPTNITHTHTFSYFPSHFTTPLLQHPSLFMVFTQQN